MDWQPVTFWAAVEEGVEAAAAVVVAAAECRVRPVVVVRHDPRAADHDHLCHSRLQVVAVRR